TLHATLTVGPKPSGPRARLNRNALPGTTRASLEKPMFDLSKPFDTKTALRPARALLTPTWIGALLLLVANDHWLKGSGMVPGVLTGKLSDFAGMLVAPTLLAALLSPLPGVRTRRALLA